MKVGVQKRCYSITRLTTGCQGQRVAISNVSSAWTGNCSQLECFMDIDPCDELLRSEKEIFSGFSRMAVVLYAAASLSRSMWIMSSYFPKVEKRRYGTSKHYA